MQQRERGTEHFTWNQVNTGQTHISVKLPNKQLSDLIIWCTLEDLHNVLIILNIYHVWMWKKDCTLHEKKSPDTVLSENEYVINVKRIKIPYMSWNLQVLVAYLALHLLPKQSVSLWFIYIHSFLHLTKPCQRGSQKLLVLVWKEGGGRLALRLNFHWDTKLEHTTYSLLSDPIVDRV